jgi:hypothetical protein
MSASCESCVLSSIGLCDGPITRPEDSYRVCVRVCVCVIESDRETSKRRRPRSTRAVEP